MHSNADGDEMIQGTFGQCGVEVKNEKRKRIQFLDHLISMKSANGVRSSKLGSEKIHVMFLFEQC